MLTFERKTWKVQCVSTILATSVGNASLHDGVCKPTVNRLTSTALQRMGGVRGWRLSPRVILLNVVVLVKRYERNYGDAPEQFYSSRSTFPDPLPLVIAYRTVRQWVHPVAIYPLYEPRLTRSCTTLKPVMTRRSATANSSRVNIRLTKNVGQDMRRGRPRRKKCSSHLVWSPCNNR